MAIPVSLLSYIIITVIKIVFYLIYSILSNIYLETIHDLQTHPSSDNYILSTSKDGTVRLWDVDAKRCLVTFEADATVTCFDQTGEKFISGNSRGELREWTIPKDIIPTENDAEPLIITKKDSKLFKKYNGDNYIGKNIHIYISL